MSLLSQVRQNLPVVLTTVVLSQVLTAAIAFTLIKTDVVPVMNQASFDKALTAAIDKQKADQIKAKTDLLFKEYGLAAEKIAGDTHVYGDPKARFSIVEFSDTECPYCKRFHNTPKTVVDRSNGAVNWMFKHMPLSFHDPVATKQAMASECYAEQKGNRGFWVIMGQIFDKSAGNGAGVEDLRGMVEGLGADMAKYDECMASGKYQERIASNISEGEKAGATGTPASLVIDHKTGKSEFVSGARPASDLITAMKKLIAYDEANEGGKKVVAPTSTPAAPDTSLEAYLRDAAAQ